MTSRKIAMAPIKPATAVELPAALVAWRQASKAGRVVQSAHGGKITLWDWQDGRLFYARFRDAAAAIAAVQDGAIDWTRKNRTAEPGGFVTCAVA